MQHLVLSCSLSPSSHSALLADHLCLALAALDEEVRRIDLREFSLPFCDAGSCYGDANVQELQSALRAADAVTLATPIYNFETGGATRNVIALGGKAFTSKVIGLACAAGGPGSYMSVMSLANSLMLDFRCVIVPRFVYATGASFSDGRLTDDDVTERINELAGELRRMATALS